MKTATARIRALALLPTFFGLAACDDPHINVTEPPEPAPARPHLITLRSDLLACTKVRLAAGDPRLQPAFDRLIAEADSALGVAPTSVTEKERVPPSGDRHDYMSLAPYWWPDPTKPDGLPYVRRDGERNPEADEDYDRQRLGRMMSAVKTLALAYHLTGDEAYARHAAVHLRTWFLDDATRMNPHLEYSQAVPGRTAGRHYGIIATGGLPRMLDSLILLRGSPHWTAFEQQRMRRWLAAFLEWLLGSDHGQQESQEQNNHGTWYDVQTAGIALFLGRSELAREILTSSETGRIATQVEPDGSQPRELARTRPFSYSVFNLRGLMQLAELGRSVDVDLWHYEAADGASIRAALDFVAPYADPAMPWPRQEVMPTSPAALFEPLRMGEIAYADSTYGELTGQIPEDQTRDHRTQLLYPMPACSGQVGGFGVGLPDIAVSRR